MRLRSNRYYMLVASLPHLPTRLVRRRLPISLEHLQDRLRMLEPEDTREIEHMMEVLRWSRQFAEPTDEAVVRRYDELMRAITNPLVSEVLIVLMDIRMITTAVRHRRLGLGPPAVGIGRWFDQIRRKFHQPDFGLGRVFPRLAQIALRIEQGDVLSVYQTLLDATWSYLTRRADDFDFSFEAVVLYVVRWNLLAQFQQMQAERGRPIFEALVVEALGEYANVYP